MTDRLANAIHALTTALLDGTGDIATLWGEIRLAHEAAVAAGQARVLEEAALYFDRLGCGEKDMMDIGAELRAMKPAARPFGGGA